MSAKNTNKIPYVDEWKPDSNDIIFRNSKNLIMAPVSAFYHLEDPNASVNYFMMNAKKSYNSDDLRDHCC